MIKDLLRKYLMERMVDEAVPMGHFKDRMKEVVDDIVSVQLPDNVYLPNVPRETQDAWIISQIKSKLYSKVAAVEAKDYPTSRGSCVLVPLGIIKLQPVKGNPTNIMITAQRKEDVKSGFSYYITVYENRMPTIVLADPKNPNNSSVGNQLNAHVANTIKNGWPVSKDKSFVDKSFMDNIIIKMGEFKA
jgi:hypothetical protein